MTALIDILRRQLAVHGYHLTDGELRDVAAHVQMCINAIELDDASADAFKAELASPSPPTKELVDLMHSAAAGPHEATRADESMWRPADLTPLKQLRLAHGLDPNTGERK